MPEFTYARQTPRSYTEARDAAGVIVGTVELGGKREFGSADDEKPGGAPDWWPAPDENWIPSSREPPPAWQGVSADMYRLPERAAGTAPAEDAPPQPPAAPPALPPASTPPADGGQEDEG